MAHSLPSRLLGHADGQFYVFDPRENGVESFDILSYRWGETVPKYSCGIPGVEWDVEINEKKLEDIKRLMFAAEVQYIWVDSVCINQADEKEKSAEIARMHQYYQTARNCYIMLDMVEVWDPVVIADSLKTVDHIVSQISAAALTSEALLSQNIQKSLLVWADRHWTFPVDKAIVRTSGIDMGLINCYSTCVRHVRSLFENPYFSRVWTFQEMLLGKNIIMWGINHQKVSRIGELDNWMDLASDSSDKVAKLSDWIIRCRKVRTAAIDSILGVIEGDKIALLSLRIQVKGIQSASQDIPIGGAHWWRENPRGISNVFSAISIRPRECFRKADIFRGLLGVFNGLFTPEEIETQISGENVDQISLAFFKRLSIKTGQAWTKLAISSGVRQEWDWIPVEANHGKPLTTDFFAGVVCLGRLKPKKPLAISGAWTGILGVPQTYMTITLSQVKENTGFRFILKGCNCGKSLKTGMFSREPIAANSPPQNIIRDETGRRLVECATLLGMIMDPGGNVVGFRQKVLSNLEPIWNTTTPSAKPMGWIDRCVSGTFWDRNTIAPWNIRVHNLSRDYTMVDIIGCESRLQNETTEKLSCEIRVKCGCVIVAPFSLVFEAITAVEGSVLGGVSAMLDEANRIILNDGLGMVQVGDVGKAFSLVAFGGKINAHTSYASVCRNTTPERLALPKVPWPMGRALVRGDFTHRHMDLFRDYGFVPTPGSGSLLICRNGPFSKYGIIGVCVDGNIPNKKGHRSVNIR